MKKGFIIGLIGLFIVIYFSGNVLANAYKGKSFPSDADIAYTLTRGNKNFFVEAIGKVEIQKNVYKYFYFMEVPKGKVARFFKEAIYKLDTGYWVMSNMLIFKSKK